MKNNIHKAMLRKNWSYTDLEASTGHDRGGLCRIAAGKTEPLVSTALKLSRSLGVPVHKLFVLEN